MMKKNTMNKKNAANVSGAILVSLFLITSVIVVGIPSSSVADPLPPKTIWGYVTYCNGGAAVGASVVVSASGYPDETDTTDGSGAYSVDIGPDTGTEWPDGTSFTVTATMGSWSGSNTGTVSGSITQVDVVLDPPTLSATASATPTTIVAGESVTFDGGASGGATPYSWFWDFDGDGTSSQEDPTHTFNNEGSYNCELTVTDDCGQTDSDSVLITVNPGLSCDAGGPYSGDICNPVQFDGTASGGHGGNTYSWTFGDGDSGTGEDPSHQYDSDGSYTATLTVTDSEGDTVSDTAPVTISTAALSADAGGPYSGSVCSPVSFTGSASGGCQPYTWSWDFGDGDNGNGQFPSHQYDSDGTYTVTLTVTSDDGDSDTDTATVNIATDALSVDAGGPYSDIVGNDIDFTGSADGGCEPYSWLWDFGDGETSNQQNPSYSYDEDGTFTVTLTVTDSVGTVESDSTTATIDPADVVADAGGPYYGAVGEQVQFSGSASIGQPPYTYFWDFGDGETGSGQNVAHTYDAPNADEGYDVVLTVTDANGNSDWDDTKAYISGSSDEPTANANGPYSGIVDQQIQFTGSAFGGAAPYSWSWDFGDGSSSDMQNPVHTYTDIGEYTVTLTVTDDEGQIDTDETIAMVTMGSADLDCSGSFSWPRAGAGATLTGEFSVSNVGDTGSMLDWEIESVPDWGTWTMSPESGSGLTPADGDVLVSVSVVAPSSKDDYSGVIVVVNSDDASDSCEIPVSLSVPKDMSPLMQLLWFLIERFPILESLFIFP